MPNYLKVTEHICSTKLFIGGSKGGGGRSFWEILKNIVCWRPIPRVGAPSYENRRSAPAVFTSLEKHDARMKILVSNVYVLHCRGE